jgi:hypothetical protein
MVLRPLFWIPVTVLTVRLLFCIPAASAGADASPLMIQNRFPLHFLFLTPRPVSAGLPSPETLQAVAALEHSNLYVDESGHQWRVLIDMEVTVLDLSLTYGLSPRAAVRVDIPVVSFTGGFMDQFLAAYHKALGLPNYGREDRPYNDFAYRLEKNGTSWINGEPNSFRLADTTLSAQWRLNRMPWPGKAQSCLLASMKLPTGEPGTGFGSGKADFGIFLPTQWNIDDWRYYFMPGLMYHGDPDTQGADIEARGNFSLFLGAVFAYNDKWSWIGQLNYFSSPIEKTGIAKLDDGAYGLTVGIRRSLHQCWDLELALTEDIFLRAAPDFNVRLGLTWRYRKG